MAPIRLDLSFLMWQPLYIKRALQQSITGGGEEITCHDKGCSYCENIGILPSAAL